MLIIFALILSRCGGPPCVVGIVQCPRPPCRDGAMIYLHVAAQQIKDYIPLVSEAGSRANVPAIVNVGDGEFEVHGKQFVEDDSIMQWQRLTNN
jgi:hypothetical protein